MRRCFHVTSVAWGTSRFDWSFAGTSDHLKFFTRRFPNMAIKGTMIERSPGNFLPLTSRWWEDWKRRAEGNCTMKRTKPAYMRHRDNGVSNMVQTSKTDHFFKLAPFRSPLTDLIDFCIAGKPLTSATRRCSPFVDSVSCIWMKPKKITDWLLGSNGCSLLANQRRREYNQRPTATVTTAIWIGLPFSVQFAEVCVRENSSCTCGGPRISVAYFPGSNRQQWNPRGLHARARSREWSSRLLRQATLKKYAYAANLRVDKLADFNDGVFFERSTTVLRVLN